MVFVRTFQRFTVLKRLSKKMDWIDFKPTKEAMSAYEIADKHIGRFSSAFLNAIRSQLPERAPSGFSDAIERGPEAVLSTLPLMDPLGKKKASIEAYDEFVKRLSNAYLDVLKESGDDAAVRVNRDLKTNFEFSVRYEKNKPISKKAKPGQKPSIPKPDLADDGKRWMVPIVPVNPYAKRWVEERCMDLVTKSITEKQWQTAKAIIEDGFKRGLRAEKLYKDIKQNIGLLPRDFNAVIKRANLMEEKGYPSEAIEKERTRYSEELLKKRAENIARTETIQAQAEGRREMWLTAQETGAMPAVKREWVSAPESDRKDRPCEDCVEMNGKQADIDGYYDGPDGPIEGVTLHPE